MAQRLVSVDDNYRFPTPLEARLAGGFAGLVGGKVPVSQLPADSLVTDENVSSEINSPLTGAAIDGRINIRVGPVVEQITADYIASDQAVIDAAAAAVDANPKVAALEAKNVTQDTAITAAKTEAIADATTKYGGLPQRMSGVEANTANLMYSLVHAPQEATGTLTTVRGTPTFVAGKFGNAVQGNLSASVLSAAGVNPEPSTNLTIECWLRSTAAAPSGGADVLWAFGNTLWLSVEPITGKLWFSAAGEGTTDVKSAESICDGLWHHIAVEIRRVAGKTELIRFWIDGAPVPGTVTPVAKTWNTTITLGGLAISGYDLPGWVSLDEFRIWAGKKYSGTFTPPTEPFAWEQNTVLLAHLDTLAISLPGPAAYPPRPSGAPGGSVTYTGPSEPTDWETNDRWVQI